MKVGVSGHQHFPRIVEDYALNALARLLSDISDLQGVTALAVGADRLFARAILELNGDFDLIVPSKDYRATFNNDQRREYDRLAAHATNVTQLPFPRSTDEAYLAAGLIVAERSDLLVALWDGKPSRGLGGTADVVSYCLHVGRPVEVIWPAGVAR